MTRTGNRETCPKCEGTKLFEGKTCPSCLGAGYMMHDRSGDGLGYAPGTYESPGQR